MFKNYLKFTIRNFLKRKSYSLINVIGLAVGIASFILIALYIIDEISYDRYHKNADNTFRLVQVGDFGGVVENSSSAPFPVAPTLLADYPHYIKSITRVFNFQNPRTHVECGENDFNEKGLFYVDSTFFEIFDVEFVTGNPKKALNSINSAVITESIARKYFDAENPIGKSLKLEEGITIRVNGVIKDTPPRSHFKYNILVSLSTVKHVYGGHYPKSWVWNPCWTYILLKNGVAKDDLEIHFPEYIDKYFYDAEKDKNSLYLQALTDIHLNHGIIS